MKKLSLLVFAIIIACTTTENKEKENFANQQQQNFDDFLAKKSKILYVCSNKIEEKEFCTQFEEEMYNYVDSLKLFVNWKGTIKDINSIDNGNCTSIEFEVFYEPEKNRRVSFICNYTLTNNNLEYDYIYNKIKNIRDYSTVYFDGFIRTKNTNKIYYHGITSGYEKLNMPYPKYKFSIIDIGTVKRNNNFSENKQKAINFVYNMNYYSKLRHLKQMSDSEMKKQYNAILSEYKEIESQLTDEEKQYIERLRTNLLNNFIHGD